MKKAILGALRGARSAGLWVGLALAFALTFGMATDALAGRGVGAVFNLGQNNVVNRVSDLTGSATTSMLRIRNQGVGPALQLLVRPGRPPMTVNSTGRVANLNADMVDGKHADSFLASNGKAADSDNLDGKDSSEFLASDGTAANSQRLGGQEPSAYLRNGAAAGGSLAGTYPNPGIAAGAVGANQIASGAVGTSQINRSQVQQRVSGSCPSTASIRSISDSGTVDCDTDGVTGREIVTNSSSFSNSAHKTATTTCPSGKIAISGGGQYSRSETGDGSVGFIDDEIALQHSIPVGSRLWHVRADWMGGTFTTPFNWRLIAHAVCINA